MKLTEILEAVSTRIRVVEPAEYAESISEAYRIMKPIDEADTPFLALGIHLNSPIWSNDKHFKRQKRVPTYTSRELGQALSIE